MAGFRKQKIEEIIKRCVGDLILKEIKDQRVGFVSISKVELSRDMETAVVYYSVLGGDKDQRNADFGLNSAKSFIRKKLGKQLQIRKLPQLVFKYDDSIEGSVDIVHLIEEVNKKSDNNEGDDQSESE
jgi:ribosome-binding factor A